MKTDPVLQRPAVDTSLYLIGRNGRGRWVVREQSGRSGGVFVDRTEALKFAMFECGRCPQSVVMVPGLLELDLNERPMPSNGQH
jgi:hypothetical protein